MASSQGLYVAGSSVVHRLPAHCKVLALVAFVFVVVATPRELFGAFAGYACVLLLVVRTAGIPARVVARRMLVEVPFVLFAVLLPFVATGPRVEVLGLRLSESGLLGGWNVLAKATLGVVASIVLAATTDQRALLVGLERLRLPRQLVEIAAFMVRYVDVIVDQLHRMRIARTARGFVARDLRSWPVLARSVGALFIRTYERGERVHLAMLSRGYDGTLPILGPAGASVGMWATAAVVPGSALVILLVAAGLGWSA